MQAHARMPASPVLTLAYLRLWLLCLMPIVTHRK